MRSHSGNLGVVEVINPGPGVSDEDLEFLEALANDIAIWALFATSLNLLVGVTGLVSFGHAAYFGVGAYTTGLLMKKLSLPFVPLAKPIEDWRARLEALPYYARTVPVHWR